MQWKDFGKGAVLGSVTVAVAAGAIHWYSGDAGANARAGDTLVLSRAEGSGAEAAAKLLAQLDEAKDRIRTLEDAAAAASRTPAANDSQKPAAAEESAPANVNELKDNDAQLAFVRKGLEDVLAKVDWNVMGEQGRKLASKLQELAEKLAKDETPPLELVGEIQGINALLVKQAGIIVEGNVPGIGPNGKFTHPLVAANQLAAIMKKAGIPLTAEQSRMLEDLAQRRAGDIDYRNANYSKDTFELQKLIDETSLKELFYKEARELLTPEQLASVDFPRIRGRANFDVMGTGVEWGQFARAVTGATRDEVAASIASSFQSRLKLSEAQQGDVSKIINKWTAKFPQTYWDAPYDTLAQARAYPVDRVEAAARLQVEMYKDIFASGVLNEEQKGMIVEFPGIFVPYVTGK